MEESKRAPNFTPSEIEKLKICVQHYSHIVESRKSDVLSHKEKAKGWKNIENEFNLSNDRGVFRSYIVLRKKWENMKKTCKKKYSDMKLHRIATGGGAAKDFKFSETDEAVLEIIGPQATGMASIADCDIETYNVQPEEIIINLENQDEHISQHNINLENSTAPNITSSMLDKKKLYDMEEKKLQVWESSSTLINNNEENNVQDWTDYTPRLLKNPVTKILNMKKRKTKSNIAATSALEESKREFIEIQKTQFLKESELRMQLMREEHDLKMQKLKQEIETRKQ